MKAKTIVIVCLLLLVTFRMYAQVDSEKALYLTKVEKYRKMKNAGSALTVVGGIMLVTGVVILANSTIETIDYGNGVTETNTTGHPVTGVLVAFGGAASLGAGIPLWTIGSRKQKQYENRLQGLSARFNVNPQSSGLTLTYRF